MDKTQNIELQVIDNNFLRNDSNNSANSESNQQRKVSYDNDHNEVVVLRHSGRGVDNPAFLVDEDLNNGKNQNYKIEVEADEFESIFDSSPKRESEELKPWDRFRTLPPPDEDETFDTEWIEILIKCLKIFAYFITFVAVLLCSMASKSIILLMTSMIRVNRTITVCNDGIQQLDRDKQYMAFFGRSDPERIAWMWCLFFAMIAPDLFAWGRSARICFFKGYHIPQPLTFLIVFGTETLHSIGLSLLMFLILPTIDAVKGAMMTNALCLIPGVLLILSKNELTSYNRILTMAATFVQLLGLVIWPLVGYYDDSNRYWYLPIALLFISFEWWENFIDPTSNNRFIKMLCRAKEDLTKTRYFSYVIVSIWKIIVIFGMMLAIEYIIDGSDAVESTFSLFVKGFQDHTITIMRDTHELEHHTMMEGDIVQIPAHPTTPIWTLVVHVIATYMCYAFGKFTCKICIQGFSFAFPVNLSVPVTISFLVAVSRAAVQDKCAVTDYFTPFQYIYWYTNEIDAFTYSSHWYNLISTFMWILALASQIWITIHIWFPTSERLASTENLFINPMYNAVIVDQSLAMNRRRINVTDSSKVKMDAEMAVEEEATYGTSPNVSHLYESVNEPLPPVITQQDSDETVRIFACATMWHENNEEMLQMLKAVMRLDADQCARRQAHQYFNVDPKLTDYYEIEINIFFDDAFDQGESDEEDDRIVNRFVKQLIEVMDEAASNVHEIPITLKRPNIVPTSYGGKLEWTMPGQNKLVAHLKDKTLIRHRKRWSQCMYMYYLLGHRIAELEIEESRKNVIAMNTFILALDGDINFRPHALHLVVDLMKKNKKLGAACGRIHPIGTGPMVWYQKFEYAIGHWLQKATEHVFGCVLCSPGCFSLFRARAVMDDSVMNKYTTKPTEALHYVQYDQGEDRWLCTLLLQQGWRIEYCAASDSYTHAPEGFGEFFTQRRRWAPSTMANIMDLLGDYKRTVEVNQDISKPYIVYQAMLMVGTVLSPGTIFLMVVGAMNTVMGFTSDISLLCNIIPILFFVIVCFTAKKNDHQIFVAMILSTAYALLMLAVLVGTGIEMADKGILTPNSLFFIGMIASFVVAAIIHPQEFTCVLPLLLYMLCIPSMYLLLTIYSIINLHVVTWGTREVKSKLTAKEQAAANAAAAEAANAKAKKKNFLGFLDFSQYGNKSGLFTCMCCSNAKAEEESAKLLEIRDQLNKVNENVSSLKNSVEYLEPQRPRGSIYRRQSSIKHDRKDSLSTLMEGQTDEEDTYSEGGRSNDEYSENERKNENKHPILSPTNSTQSLPKWVRNDKYFKKYPVVQLSDKERQFWLEFIPKYLYPLDEDAKHQARIAAELKELRNRAVFAFGILNTIFILFVYLLQMHQDIFGVEFPSGIRGYNRTYIEEEDRWIETPIYNYVKMDPIGLVLVVFFGSILLVQCIGMFMHRFGTLAHLLAFTTIDFFTKKQEDQDERAAFDRSAVKIVKQLHKITVAEFDEGIGQQQIDPQNRRMSMYPKPPKQLNLEDAFRSRIMSITDENLDKTDNRRLSGLGLARQSTIKQIRQRRDTMMPRKMSEISDKNDSTITSETRPRSLLGVPNAFEAMINNNREWARTQSTKSRNSRKSSK